MGGQNGGVSCLHVGVDALGNGLAECIRHRGTAVIDCVPIDDEDSRIVEYAGHDPEAVTEARRHGQVEGLELLAHPGRRHREGIRQRRRGMVGSGDGVGGGGERVQSAEDSLFIRAVRIVGRVDDDVAGGDDRGGVFLPALRHGLTLTGPAAVFWIGRVPGVDAAGNGRGGAVEIGNAISGCRHSPGDTDRDPKPEARRDDQSNPLRIGMTREDDHHGAYGAFS